MADLKTSYTDDVLDTSKNTKRKYNIIQNEDGTVSFEDVTEYLQIGDVFSGGDLNKTNAAINNNTKNISELNSKIVTYYKLENDSAVVSSTSKQYATYNNRRFNQYDIFEIILATGGYVRNSIVVTSDIFKSVPIDIEYVDASNVRRSVTIKYVDNTHYSLQAFGEFNSSTTFVYIRGLQ